jgi:hypothetical protein
MKIYAPVKATNGVYASVRFVNGVGETDNPRLIEWFRNHGYKIEKSVEKCDELTEEVDQPDFDSMTPLELRDWAKANGFGSQINNTRSKEKLIKILRG